MIKIVNIYFNPHNLINITRSWRWGVGRQWRVSNLLSAFIFENFCDCWNWTHPKNSASLDVSGKTADIVVVDHAALTAKLWKPLTDFKETFSGNKVLGCVDCTYQIAKCIRFENKWLPKAKIVCLRSRWLPEHVNFKLCSFKKTKSLQN